MKRIFKKNSRRGFTLLEVMLAIVILVISSTMIMEGFMAVMNYANNSAVYSRIGSQNYEALISKLASSSNKKLSEGRYSLTGGASGGQMTFENVSINSPIYVWHYTGGTTTTSRDGSSTMTANKVNSVEGEELDLVVDNRTAFFYLPHIDTCTQCGASGYFRLCNYTSEDGTVSVTNRWICTYIYDKNGDGTVDSDEYCLNGV